MLITGMGRAQTVSQGRDSAARVRRGPVLTPPPPAPAAVVGPGQFQITVKSQDYDLEPASGCRCLLAVSCPARYPDEPPQVEIVEEPDNCTPLEVEQLMETMQAEVGAGNGHCS